MIVLGIDTSTSMCSVALTEATQVIASYCLRPSSTRALSLLRMIDVICKQSRLSLTEIRGVAVALGPGSFTSLRVGLATAQGIAMAQNIPLIGCTTFEALAMYARGWGGIICPVIDARKGEVYAALYRYQDNGPVEVMPGKMMPSLSLCSLVTERTMFVGSGVKTYGTTWSHALEERAIYIEGVMDTGLADQVARLGYRRLPGVRATPQPVLRPLYIRPADARLLQHPGVTAVNVLPDIAPEHMSDEEKSQQCY